MLLGMAVNGCDLLTGACVASLPRSDQTTKITVTVRSDAGDVPAIAQTAGPAIVPVSVVPAGRGVDAKGVQFGIQAANYEWTPPPADIGLNASASFTATTGSGKTLAVTVPLGVVQDVAPGILSGVVATRNGANFDVAWDPPADGSAVVYQLCAAPALDPVLGGPACIAQPLPGVPTITNPGGTLTQAAIVGLFAGTPTQAVYIRLQALSATTLGLLQENVLELPE
jgi:hypothetical protein